MQVSKEEILHIANLARLDLNENEVDKYIENLQDILNFANIVNNAPVEGLDITIGANEAKNINLDVWSYTGFKFEELIDRKNPLYFENVELLKYIDVLVDGKFIYNKKKIGLKFRGSYNQRIIDVKESLQRNEVILKNEYMEKRLELVK